MRAGRQRAFVLAAVFFVMVVIILLIASLFRLVPQEVRWTSDHRRETLAYYTATGGVKHALAWLRKVRQQDSPGNDPFHPAANAPYERITLSDPAAPPLLLRPAADPDPAVADTYFPLGMPALRSRPGRIRLGQGWTADVYIVPDKRTNPHPFLGGRIGTLPPCYTLVAVAYVDSNNNGVLDGGELPRLRVESSVVESTFAHYAYFVDLWPDAGAASTAFNVLPRMAEALFAGPVHVNDTPVLRVKDSAAFWAEPDFVAPFGGELSFSGDRGPNPKVAASYDGVAYYGGNFQGSSATERPYQGSASPFTPIPERYNRLFRQGEAAIRRTQRIALPDDWARLAEAAWGKESGREVEVGSAPPNQLFVNREDLGIAVTGGLKEVALDVVDPNGTSLVFDASGNVRGSVNNGEPLVRLTQLQEVTYVAGYQDVPVTTTQVISTTGPHTQTQYSDTPQAGYNTDVYSQEVGTTTRQVPQHIQVGSTVINDPPGGAGPGGGGTVVVPQYSTTTVAVSVPVYQEATRYVREEVVSGPYTVTNEVPTGETRREPILETFRPQDAVVTAKNADVQLPVNYFVPGGTPSSEFAVFQGATTGLQVTIPKGKSAIVRQDRAEGKSFDVRLLDGEPSGVLAVYGPIESLKGVNSGAKTILAADPGTPRLKPTALQNIDITDQLLHFGVTPGQLPTNGNNSLGVIGAEITLPGDRDTLMRFPAGNPFYIYASIFSAQGGFLAKELVSTTDTVLGELRVIGGVIQKRIGQLVAGTRGWSSRYRYDRFLSRDAPPAFPPDGRFEVTFFRVTTPGGRVTGP
jgi:hypothetical protein